MIYHITKKILKRLFLRSKNGPCDNFIGGRVGDVDPSLCARLHKLAVDDILSGGGYTAPGVAETSHQALMGYLHPATQHYFTDRSEDLFS